MKLDGLTGLVPVADVRDSHRKCPVRRTRQRVHEITDTHHRLQCDGRVSHDLSHLQLIRRDAGVFGLVQKRSPANLNVGVVDAHRVPVPDVLGEEDRDHQWDDELHRARRLHHEHGDANGHARRAAQHGRRAHHRVRVQVDDDVGPRAHDHGAYHPADDLPTRGAHRERRHEQPGGRADAVRPRHQRVHEEKVRDEL